MGQRSRLRVRGPPPAAGLVNVLLEIDHDRFKQLFVDLMTQPIGRS